MLVSGGSRGIGRALAEGFAERGAQTVICGREQATLEQTAREISSGALPSTRRPSAMWPEAGGEDSRLVNQTL